MQDEAGRYGMLGCGWCTWPDASAVSSDQRVHDGAEVCVHVLILEAEDEGQALHLFSQLLSVLQGVI